MTPDKIQQIIAANITPRYRVLDHFERWVEGRQYEGLPDWFTGGPQEVPLWERAPVVVYPVVQVAIRSNTELVFGEGRFPKFEPVGVESELSEDLGQFVDDLHEQCCFEVHCQNALEDAQGCGTAVSVYGYRDGQMFAETLSAKWCTPTFHEDGSVASLEVRYPYVVETKINGRWEKAVKLYRRTIDATSDKVYLPADANEYGTDPVWQENSARSVTHGLGFCPVIWYAFMRGHGCVERVDGHPIHETLLDEIRGHDLALSQKHRCMLFSEPQPYEIGVERGYNPTDTGRTGEMIPTVAPDGTVTGHYRTGSSQVARKRGPGWMWTYPDKDTKVGYLTFPSEVLKAMEEHCRDLLGKIEDGLAVVLPKPAEFRFAVSVSGRAIELTRERQYQRCNRYRSDVWANFLLPSLRMQLRLAETFGDRAKFPNGVQPSQVKNWMPQWGKYQNISNEEERRVVTTVRQAIGDDRPLITPRLALQKLADTFGIDDINKALAELEAGEGERLSRDVERAKAEAEAFRSMDHGLRAKPDTEGPEEKDDERPAASA